MAQLELQSRLTTEMPEVRIPVEDHDKQTRDIRLIADVVESQDKQIQQNKQRSYDPLFVETYGGYEKGTVLTLTNGLEVVAQEDGTNTNPNNDLTGWVVKTVSSDQVNLDTGNLTDYISAYKVKPVPDFDPDTVYEEGALVIKDNLIQKYTNGSWQPKDATYYDFGAKIDGVTDDTAAFIAYHSVFKSGKLPKGRMLLSSIDLDQFIQGQTLGLNITGEGTEATYLDFTGSKGFYSGTNKFFRDFKLRNLQINNKNANQTGIGFYVGSAGSEQINFESVTYRGWLIGRSSHTWNSSFRGEVFRVCKYPYVMYGTSTDVNCPYAVGCTSPFMIGYMSDSNGNVSVPSIPYAYSTLSSHAADDCGLDGSLFKFGRCSGITCQTMGGERPKGQYIFDFNDLVASSSSNVTIENYVVYITTGDSSLLGIAKKPSTAFGNVVFNSPKVSTDREIYFVSGDGSGVSLVNPQISNRLFTRLVELPAVGVKVNGLSIGQDFRENGEIGLSLSANSVTYPRVKTRKGKALIDPNTQKLVLYCGSLAEGLAQGNMMAAIITALPINKNGGNAGEKAGQVLISSAMDYNASDMTGHLKVVTTGTFTALTTATRNTSNTTVLQFDVVFEASSANTRFLLDIDLTFNGISNVNGLSWQVVAK